ncbi:DUF488 family protein [Desulfovibrio sp. QI0430]
MSLTLRNFRKAAPAAVAQLQTILRQNPTVILLYAAKATEMNNAVALKEYIEDIFHVIRNIMKL